MIHLFEKRKRLGTLREGKRERKSLSHKERPYGGEEGSALLKDRKSGLSKGIYNYRLSEKTSEEGGVNNVLS